MPILENKYHHRYRADCAQENAGIYVNGWPLSSADKRKLDLHASHHENTRSVLFRIYEIPSGTHRRTQNIFKGLYVSEKE